MLHLTNVKLDLISDTAMYEMIDSGIRGGVAMISTRFARANKPGSADYDPNLPESSIIGLDANNLYGCAMSQHLPDGQFSWVDVAELERIDWKNQSDNQEWGYFPRIDLHYPAELHDLHNDYPLAPERIYVQQEWLSDKQIDLHAQYHMPRTDFNAKLIPNLMDKKEYVCDYRLLKLYLNKGLVQG